MKRRSPKCNFPVICSFCEEEFLSLRKNGKFCSKKCQWRHDQKEKIRDPIKVAYNHRKLWLKTQYGITLEQYDELLEKQNHSCAVCKRHKSEFKTNLAVDHQHGSGELGGSIRGLLCNYCNRTVIGRNKDPVLFHNAAKYLEGPYTGWVVPKRKPKKRKRK